MSNNMFLIGKKEVGQCKPCFIIADVAQAHDGSLGAAHAYIDAAAKCGIDAIKFQTHIAEAESSVLEPWRTKFSYQDETRYDYWKRMEFTIEQWAGLKKHAEDRGLEFLSSPFSIEAVDLLEKIGMKGWKIASGEINNFPMLDRIMCTNKPIIISSGMSTLAEIGEAVNFLNKNKAGLAILQCTTKYPCPAEYIGINNLRLFKERYKCVVGLSDHSGTIFPGLCSVSYGAKIVEEHIVFNKEMFGPDVSSSLTLDEFTQLVAGIRFIETMIANPIEKDALSEHNASLKKIFNKSIFIKNDIQADSIIRIEDLCFKKPGSGIPANDYKKVVGRKASKDLISGNFLKYNDIQE